MMDCIILEKDLIVEISVSSNLRIHEQTYKNVDIGYI